MAARRRNAKKAAPKKAAKKTKAPKAAKAAKAPKEVSPGPPVEVVLCIVTGLMLLAAVVLVDYTAGHKYGAGAMFAGSYESSH